MRAAALLLALAPLVAPPAPPAAAGPSALPGKVGDVQAWLLEPHAAAVKLTLRRALENGDRRGDLDARPYDLGRPEYRTRPQAVLLPSSVLVHTGRLSEAIELLRGQVVLAGPGGAVDPPTMFALAVAYDRGEQISLACDALARTVGQNNGNDQLMNVLFAAVQHIASVDRLLAADRLRGAAHAARRRGSP